MATQRKRWFRVGDSILREDWDDATLATVLRLCAWLNQRWARDGIPHAEAGFATIGEMDAMKITNVKKPLTACKRLSNLPLLATLRGSQAELLKGSAGYKVKIEWPNFAEFQEYGSRLPGSDGAVTSLVTPPTNTPTKTRQDKSTNTSRDSAEPDPSVKPAKEKPQPSAFDVEMADLLTVEIYKSNPNTKQITANRRKSWAEICRKMRTSDSLSEKQIRYALEWVFTKANTEAECSFVVQSMQALRKKWNPIVARIQKLKDAPEHRTAKPAEVWTPSIPQEPSEGVQDEIIKTLDLIEGGNLSRLDRKREVGALNCLKMDFKRSGAEIDPNTHARMQKIFGMA